MLLVYLTFDFCKYTGYHRGMNNKAGHGKLAFYVLIPLLHHEAKMVDYNVNQTIGNSHELNYYFSMITSETTKDLKFTGTNFLFLLCLLLIKIFNVIFSHY